MIRKTVRDFEELTVLNRQSLRFNSVSGIENSIGRDGLKLGSNVFINDIETSMIDSVPSDRRLITEKGIKDYVDSKVHNKLGEYYTKTEVDDGLLFEFPPQDSYGDIDGKGIVVRDSAELISSVLKKDNLYISSDDGHTQNHVDIGCNYIELNDVRINGFQKVLSNLDSELTTCKAVKDYAASKAELSENYYTNRETDTRISTQTLTIASNLSDIFNGFIKTTVNQKMEKIKAVLIKLGITEEELW